MPGIVFVVRKLQRDLWIDTSSAGGAFEFDIEKPIAKTAEITNKRTSDRRMDQHTQRVLDSITADQKSTASHHACELSSDVGIDPYLSAVVRERDFLFRRVEFRCELHIEHYVMLSQIGSEFDTRESLPEPLGVHQEIWYPVHFLRSPPECRACDYRYTLGNKVEGLLVFLDMANFVGMCANADCLRCEFSYPFLFEL